MSVGRTLAVSSLSLALVACAHGKPRQEVSVDEMQRKMESLRAQNAGYVRQIEELENRVFILSDQQDSRKVEGQRVAAPELPKVTLKPDDAPVAAEPVSSGDPEVVYEGDAAKPTARRPMLRLNGDEVPVLPSREAKAETRPPEPKPSEAKAAAAPEPGPTVPIVREGVPRAARPAVKTPTLEAFEGYRRAYAALREHRHDEAAEGFRTFLRQHADHELADNAQYWLAECYYDRKDYVAAVREFRRVVERYAQGNKVPDALLKIGFSYLALGSADAGRQTLEQLVRSYPRHPAATLASARLAELGRVGQATVEEVR